MIAQVLMYISEECRDDTKKLEAYAGLKLKVADL